MAHARGAPQEGEGVPSEGEGRSASAHGLGAEMALEERWRSLARPWRAAVPPLPRPTFTRSPRACKCSPRRPHRRSVQVNVHTLSPGMVFTDLLLNDSTPELRKFPFGVLAAQPDEVRLRL